MLSSVVHPLSRLHFLRWQIARVWAIRLRSSAANFTKNAIHINWSPWVQWATVVHQKNWIWRLHRDNRMEKNSCGFSSFFLWADTWLSFIFQVQTFSSCCRQCRTQSHSLHLSRCSAWGDADAVFQQNALPVRWLQQCCIYMKRVSEGTKLRAAVKLLSWKIKT